MGEYGEKLNALTEFVASSTLEDAPWGDFPAATVTRDPVATVRDLTEQDGKDIWLRGSLTLMHSLLGAGVVDEVRMLVCPASRGKGTCVFEDRQDLRLMVGIFPLYDDYAQRTDREIPIVRLTPLDEPRSLS